MGTSSCPSALSPFHLFPSPSCSLLLLICLSSEPLHQYMYKNSSFCRGTLASSPPRLSLRLSASRPSLIPSDPAFHSSPSPSTGTAFGQAAALTTRAHQAEWGQVSQPEGTSFKVKSGGKRYFGKEIKQGAKALKGSAERREKRRATKCGKKSKRLAKD